MYRFDNDIIFEEQKTQDLLPTDPAAVVLEKDGKVLLLLYPIIFLIGNYWIYHRATVDDFDEEK